MKRKYFIAILAIVTLFAACKNPAGNDTHDSNVYTVTFDKNHSDATGYTEASPKTKTVKPPATTVVALPAAPTRTGYEFVNWAVNKDGSGDVFTATTTVEKSITVYAQWREEGVEPPEIFTISFNISGNVSGDSVAASPTSGEAGAAITINYTLANTKINNLLSFSGTQVSISHVASAGTGTREYIVTAEDAINKTITINATFTHTDKTPDTIAFAESGNITKTYGDDNNKFTKVVTNTGSGLGTITYSSNDTSVATVNSSTGEVTILKAGGCSIIATKEADGSYEGTTADYTLHIAQRQLTISGTTVTQTKVYDGTTTAAVTNVGTLANVVGGDTVNVSAIAAYNSANVVEANKITVTYTISGTDAGNYIKPTNLEITSGVSITKAFGATVGVPTVAYKTHNLITVNTVNVPSSGQAVEYAIVISSLAPSPPSSGWQSSTTFTGLEPETSYNVYARAIANDNYNQGAAQMSAAITTNPAPTPGEIIPVEIVNFENDTLGTTTKYTFTRGDNDPTVTIVTDPVNSGGKSLQIVTNGSTDKTYNQATVIPINLPYALQDYKNFTFRFNYTSGNLSNQSINVYVAKNTSTFVRYGFGNPADHSNQSQQFAANLLGTVQPDYTTGQWQNLTITITNPSAAIKDLKGDVFLAIGINHGNSITYLLDDITFNIKDGFEPPYVPPAPTPTTFPAAVPSGSYRNLFKEFGKTDLEIDAKVNAAWNRLFVNGTADQKIYYEVANEMAYILDTGNNDVRSEGMSYGMMMAVQMNKKTEFDRLWKWARTNMKNETKAGKNQRGYFAWQCNTDGSKKDPAAAPDGEFYFVTSLLFASARWGDGSGIMNYRKEAMQILYDMLHRFPDGTIDGYEARSMFNLTNFMTVFVPYGNSYTHTDPSYHLPAFYEIWAIEVEESEDYWNEIWGSEAAAKTDAAFWRNAASASRTFFPTTVHATTGLGPDYANFDGTPVSGQHADFRYDAWRIAMNIGMDYSWWKKDPWQTTFADRIQNFFYGKGVNSYGHLWTLAGTLLNETSADDHSPGLVACNAVASFAASQNITWEFIEDFWNAGMTSGQYRYYDGCLYMLGLLHVSGNFKAYFPANRATSSTISPTTATFDKKEDAQADVAVTMTLNGNTLSSISGGSPSITASNYTVSGNTVTIKKEYLAQQVVGTTTLTFNFSAGNARSIAITIGDTTGGGPIGGGGTEYDFTTNPSITVEYAGNGTMVVNVQGNVLRVEKTNNNHTSPMFILPFDLGSTTLANYSSLVVEIRGVSGDYSNKGFTAEIRPAGTVLATVSNAGLSTTWKTLTIPISSSAPSTLTGAINIGFWLNNTQDFVYEIQSIKFVQ
jgi:oligosaccharide reducing-end xylanase